MAQDKYILAHQNKLKKLRESVKGRKEEILQSIDIDEMMMSPKAYLMRIGKEFYNSNKPKMQEAIKSGKSLATRILKETGNGQD